MSLQLERRFPRYSLMFGPSPVHKLERISSALGVEVWAKRDDVSSGLAFGGNKIRKLEWIVPEAISQGCDTLVSIGGVQSNHTRQVAAVAARIGMKCHLVLENWAQWEAPLYDKVGNLLLSKILGAKTVRSGGQYSTDFKSTLADECKTVEEAGGKAYSIPAGASDHHLGGLGYAHFADELATQEHDIGIFFDTVITASCTGSTQGGMIVGFAAQPNKRRLIGIDTAAVPDMTRRAVAKSVSSTASLVDLKRDVPSCDIIVDERFAGPAYGVPDEQTLEAIRFAAHNEGMITDPVYEGKSMAGLLSLIRSGEISPQSKVLYVHLGGAPAINAYHAAFRSTVR